MKFYIFTFLVFITSLTVWSQDTPPKNKIDNEKLIQLTGVVVSSDSLAQMSYAAVFNSVTKRGTLADFYGYFSLVVQPGDTLIFRSYSHKTSSYIVPDTLKEKRYSIVHMMDPDYKELPEVTVYPWPSREEFAKAFVEMETYDDALRRAQKQLSGESLAFAAAKMTTDASMTYNWQRAQNQTRLYTMGQTPVNNLLNPVAWSKFITAWKKGELGRQ